MFVGVCCVCVFVCYHMGTTGGHHKNIHQYVNLLRFKTTEARLKIRGQKCV
jgi:hypothetical protein